MKIIVDDFSLKTECKNCFYILTHCHTDHCSIPKNFTHFIYCSPLTALIVLEIYPHTKKIIKGNLIANCWNKIKNQKIFIFDSCHSIGSIGFFYPKKNYLHFGDGRPSKQLIQFLRKNIKTNAKTHIETDSFFIERKFLNKDIPTIDDSLLNLMKIIDENYNKKKIWIKIPHLGILYILPSKYNYNYISKKSFSSLPDIACKFVFNDLLKLNTKKSGIKVSLEMPNEKNYLIIHLSTNWWLMNLDKNLYEPYYINENYVRLFLCQHASQKENDILIKSFQR